MESLAPLAKGISRDYLLHHRLCPWRVDSGGALQVALGSTPLREALPEISCAYDLPVVTHDVSDSQLDRLIERVTSHADRSIELSRIAGDDEHETREADVRDLVNQPPVVRYVNLLVREAYDARASDIHLEATQNDLVARFRLDGTLVPAPESPPQIHHAVVSRLKLLAELDIAERRRPQDGRIRVRLEDRELDLRVSTIPTVFGESVVLRLLDHGGRPVQLDELGLTSDFRKQLTDLVARPHGMLLVTGPTGSGKTTTLYAALQHRNGDREKIITVEDPVEYQLPGVTQVPVQRQAGVTFATALRAILRQDPDVVMIGEMRDSETAEIAVQASMTGHLVLSTLHTNDALRAIPRLLDLGVPEYLVGATLGGVLAQRLVRRICDGCRETYKPDPLQVMAISNGDAKSSEFTRGRGCSICRWTGFRGRIGIFELLLVNESIKHAIAQGSSLSALQTLAERSGYMSMRTDGWHKVRAGLTTLEEVFHAVQG